MNSCTKSSVVFLGLPPLLAFRLNNFALGIPWYLVFVGSLLNHHRKNYTLGNTCKQQKQMFALDHVSLIVGASTNMYVLHDHSLIPEMVLYAWLLVFALVITHANRQAYRAYLGWRFEPIAMFVHLLGACSNIYILQRVRDVPDHQ